MKPEQHIKNYVDQHKIASLFEELMSRLILDLPKEPIPFLIRLLQAKMEFTRPQTVMSITSLRRNMGSQTVPKMKPAFKPSSASSMRQSKTPEGLPKSAVLKPKRIKSATFAAPNSAPLSTNYLRKSKELEDYSFSSPIHSRIATVLYPKTITYASPEKVTDHIKRPLSKSASQASEITNIPQVHKGQLKHKQTPKSVRKTGYQFSEVDSQEDALERLESNDDIWEEDVQNRTRNKNQHNYKPTSSVGYAYCPRCSLVISLTTAPTKLIFTKHYPYNIYMPSKPIIYSKPSVPVRSSVGSINSDENPIPLKNKPSPPESTVDENIGSREIGSCDIGSREIGSREVGSRLSNYKMSPVVERYSPLHLSSTALTEDLFLSSTPKKLSPATSPVSFNKPVVQNLVDTTSSHHSASHRWPTYEDSDSDQETVNSMGFNLPE